MSPKTDRESQQNGHLKRSVTLITGASGGIGADLARVFARHGHDLALVARSKDKLEALADEITALGRPRPLILAFDLTKPESFVCNRHSFEGGGSCAGHSG